MILSQLRQRIADSLFDLSARFHRAACSFSIQREIQLRHYVDDEKVFAVKLIKDFRKGNPRESIQLADDLRESKISGVPIWKGPSHEVMDKLDHFSKKHPNFIFSVINA